MSDLAPEPNPSQQKVRERGGVWERAKFFGSQWALELRPVPRATRAV
jgi:hypothetical protein